MLWSGLDPPRALASLRSALWELTRLLGAEWLDADRSSLAFRRDAAVWVDAGRFQMLVAASSPLEQLLESVDLYRGDFLQGLAVRDSPSFEEWQIVQREHFRRHFVRALLRIVDTLAGAGQVSRAVPHAERLVTLDPFHEEAQRRLIQLYAASGRWAEAARQYETFAQALRDEIGVLPEDETRRLYRAVTARRPPPAVEPQPPSSGRWRLEPPRVDLPAPVAPFVGRAGELRLLAQRLDDPSCRLVTISGPGGAGKTSLALEAARRHAPDCPDGACMVALSAMDSKELVAAAITDALGTSADRQMLLVLDAFEQRMDAASIVSDLLARAPALQILVTSRERLNLRGEWDIALEGFPCGEDATSPDALELFAQVAARADASFALGDDQAPVVARICRLVGGLPLGIELAAARVRTHTLEEIAAQIEHDLDFLTAPRDAPARQRSLRATFLHSWALLDDEERGALRRLSVFQRAFTRDAAEAVADARPAVVSALEDKFLVRRAPGRRLQIHEVIHRYAHEELLAVPEEHRRVHERHADYFAERLAAQRSELDGPRRRAALADAGAELDDARMAIRGSAKAARFAVVARALDGLCAVEDALGHLHELATVLRETSAIVRDAGAEPALLGRLLTHQARVAHELGAPHEAAAHLDEGVRLLRRDGALLDLCAALRSAGALAAAQINHAAARWCYRGSLVLAKASADRRAVAEAMCGLAAVAFHQARHRDAERMLGKSLAIFRALEDARGVAGCLGDLAAGWAFRGEFVRAEAALQEGLQELRPTGERRRTAELLVELGRVLCERDDLEGAGRKYTEALELGRWLRHPGCTAAALHGLGHVQRRRRDHARAWELLTESLSIYRRSTARRGFAKTLTELGAVASERGDVDCARSCFHAAIEAATEAGAVALVLATLIEAANLGAGASDRSRAALSVIAGHPAAEWTTRERASRMLAGTAGPRLPKTTAVDLAALVAGVLQPEGGASPAAQRRSC